MKALGLVAVLLAVGGAAWLLLGDDAGPVGDGVTADDETRDTSAPTLLAEGRRRPDDVATQTPGKTTDASSDAQDDEQATPHLVEGRIEGLSPAHLAETTVTVLPLGEHDWVNTAKGKGTATPDADGRFSVDIGTLRKDLPDLTRIQVAVDHPLHVVVKRKLPIVRDAPRTGIDDPFRLTLAILVPIEVLDADGGALVDATAALVPLDGEGKPILSDWDPIVIDSGQTDAEGTITLRADKPGPAAVLAGAKGHLVQSQTLHLTAGGPQPAPFRLVRSVSIRGRVFLNGAPAGGFRVQASRTRPGLELDLFDIDAVWVDGKAVTGGWHVKRVADDGTYELEGLAPGSWNVSVQDNEHRRFWSGKGKIEGKQRKAEAPAQDVDFDVRASVLDVRVLSDGEPLKRGHVILSVPDRSSVHGYASPEGLVRFVVPAGQAFVLESGSEKHLERTLDVSALGEGETRALDFELGSARAEATVYVVVKDEDGKPVERAGFRFVEDEETGAHWFDGGNKAEHEGDGVYRIENVLVGAQRLIVTPGRSPNEWHGHLLNEERKVTIHEDRENRITVTARRGTRVRVSAKDAAGTFLECSAKLLDGDGQEVEVGYCHSDETSATMSSGNLGATVTTIEPPLAPGTYLLKLSRDGFEDQEVRFVLDGEPTRDLEITMRKR